MSTSGSIDANLNAQQIATFALKKAGFIDPLHTPAAEEMRDALEDLGLMLKSWQATGPNLWRQTFGSVPLVASTASYTLSPRPFSVIEARYRSASNIDLPMNEMTRQEYVELPQKTSSGTPTSYYVDRQRSSVVLYVWPVPASVTTETIQYSYQRVIEDIDEQTDDLDIPQEWLETVGYNLAVRIAGRDADDSIRRIAAQLLATAMDADRESTVLFMPEEG